jgi:hypothetical protein
VVSRVHVGNWWYMYVACSMKNGDGLMLHNCNS